MWMQHDVFRKGPSRDIKGPSQTEKRCPGDLRNEYLQHLPPSTLPRFMLELFFPGSTFRKRRVCVNVNMSEIFKKKCFAKIRRLPLKKD